MRRLSYDDQVVQSSHKEKRTEIDNQGEGHGISSQQFNISNHFGNL
jgi:hypothetical protein